MRYVDSALDHAGGDRLAGWLGQELPTAEVLTLRTGFFTARAVAVVQDALEGLLGRGGGLLAVVGGDLLQCDVDLKDRNAVMETADVVVLLHRPDTDERDHPRMGEADLAIVKNRYGALGKVTIAHQLHYARFASVAAAPPSPPTTPPRPAASPPPATRLRPKPQPAGGRSNQEERLITAGDVAVVMRSVGWGDPPVICLGRAEPADDEWAALTARLESATRTITCRGPGCGGTDPLSGQIADGLHTIDSVVTRLDSLLDEARISPPLSWSPARSARGSPTGTPPARLETSPGWC